MGTATRHAFGRRPSLTVMLHAALLLTFSVWHAGRTDQWHRNWQATTGSVRHRASTLASGLRNSSCFGNSSGRFSSNRLGETIRWKWTADGQYTARSAYEREFHGPYANFKPMTIWKSSCEKLRIRANSSPGFAFRSGYYQRTSLQHRGWPQFYAPYVAYSRRLRNTSRWNVCLLDKFGRR